MSDRTIRKLRSTRGAFMLVEAMMALVILSLVVVSLMEPFSMSLKGAAAAEEAQVAARLGARIVDALQASGYLALRARTGTEGYVPLQELAVPPGPGREIVIDGVTFAARYRIDAPAAGLVRLRVTLEWQRLGGSGRRAAPLSFLRYVGDPSLATVPADGGAA